jgi:hypothetical protein
MLSLSISPSFSVYDQEGVYHGLAVGPKYRVNERFSISYIMDYNHKLNDIGFAGIQNSDVIIGRRNREIYKMI